MGRLVRSVLSFILALFIVSWDTHQPSKRDALQNQEKTLWWARLYTILTVLIAVAGMWAAFKAGEAADAASRQAAVAEDIEKRQLRAYLAANASQLRDLSGDKSTHVTLIVTNSGQTSAYHVKWDTKFRIDTDYQPIGYDPPCPQLWRTNVEEGNMGILSDKIAKVVYDTKSGINPTFIHSTSKIGGMVVYFYGKICYEDIFRQVHWTLFCINWKGNDSGYGEAEYCDKGANESDRDEQEHHDRSQAP